MISEGSSEERTLELNLHDKKEPIMKQSGGESIQGKGKHIEKSKSMHKSQS